MSIHIHASKGAIAKTVLLAGDPLRAKYVAEHYLSDAQLISNTRNVLYFTGTYKNKTITVGASGMGAPSMGIYSYELYTEFEVETIIRIGTCGAYSTKLSLYDLVNVEKVVSESNYALQAWDMRDNILTHQGNTFDVINQTASIINADATRIKMHIGTVQSSDVFYHKSEGIPSIATDHDCIAVEMETFALFANAQYLQKNAAAILTVSDIIGSKQMISSEEREKTLTPMMELALEAAIQL